MPETVRLAGQAMSLAHALHGELVSARVRRYAR